jgi:hypothetical protein
MKQDCYQLNHDVWMMPYQLLIGWSNDEGCCWDIKETRNAYKILVGEPEGIKSLEEQGKTSEKNRWPTFLCYGMDNIENNAYNNYPIIACVFIATGMCLLSH